MRHFSCHFYFGKPNKWLENDGKWNDLLAFELCENVCVFRLPFDVNHPIGYTIAALVEWTMVTYTLFVMMTIISIGVSSYLFVMSLTEDLKSILQSIGGNSQFKDNRPKLYAQSIEFIVIHSDAIKLSIQIKTFNSLCYSGLILFLQPKNHKIRPIFHMFNWESVQIQKGSARFV